jgi:two-component system, OmpR family, phosphate regulon sensor histidine kinase PhoR
MIDRDPLRIAVALFVIAAVAAIAYQLGLSGWAAFAVVATGLAVLLLLTVAPAHEPVQIRSAPAPNDQAEGAVVAALAEPVLLVVDGRVRFANAAARMLLGAHIVGEDIRLAIRHPAAAEHLAAAAPDGSVELVGVGGRDSRVELNVASLGPGRRLIHLIDRTARHAVEQARVDFVANASHELRTPLAAILGFIETLDDEKAGGDAEVRARFLEVMFKEARRMQRLIDDLISLSRIEAEKYVLPGSTVVLPSLVEEVSGELRDAAGARRTDIVLDLDIGVSDVTGDRAQLSQVIHNLVGNAIKYGRRDAPVTIGLKSDGPLVRLSVTDEGEGIAPEHLPRLTERFYRVDSGRSRAMGGTGLGLAIVKHIVERHRGRLEIVSRLGKGTTVSVILPPATRP